MSVPPAVSRRPSEQDAAGSRKDYLVQPSPRISSLPTPGANVLVLDGESLTAEGLMRIHADRSDNYVECVLSDKAWDRIRVGRDVIDRAIASGKVVYGVNTGFGSFQNVSLRPDQLEELQVNLIRSHASGVGPDLSLDRTRRLLALRINVLAKGYSGVRPETVERMLAFLNSNCLSRVPQQGSVGASGDLAPLSHLALGMMGEGDMWNPMTGSYEPAAKVIADNGLQAIQLTPKEGLALINGTQFICALTAEGIVRAELCAKQADIIAAVTMEAVRATPTPFAERVHTVRNQTGQMESATRLRAVLHSEAHPSDIFLNYPHSVQDAYSLRCVPQVHGIVHDTVQFVKRLVSRELNAATDNPMVFAEDDSVISAGNFHGEYPAKAADYLAVGISELASISERRIERLVNHHLSGPRLKPDERGITPDLGLPHFLVREGGLNSGFMIAQCTAAALVSENKVLVHPASCDSIPTSAAQEDHVSMGPYAARKVLQVVENVERVLAIELMAAVQGLDFLRPHTSTAAIERVYAAVRAKVPFIEKDVYMTPYLDAVWQLVRDGDILRAVDLSSIPSVLYTSETVSASSILRSAPSTSLLPNLSASVASLPALEVDEAADEAGVDLYLPPSMESADVSLGAGIATFAEAAYGLVSVFGGPLAELTQGIPNPLPPPITSRDPSVPHAPKRIVPLSPEEIRLALQNALRYFPPETHAELAPEFLKELEDYGHIYMYRLLPTSYEMRAYSVHSYPAKSIQAACIMLMIQNNLDSRVAQFPHELITYGGNGSVFSNWAQYRLVMKYLSEMTDEQTLVMYSGHPMGLFPSHKDAPRVVVTNGMVIWNYSSRADYDRLYALGVSQFGQMTAGSYCYIGPQGIVHGTTLTLLNASRRYLSTGNMAGKVYVTSGLGGMSGAQAKAAVICGAVGVIAEVSWAALKKRHDQGWLVEIITDVNDVIKRIRELKGRSDAPGISIGYHGNVVTLWEALAAQEDLLVDLGSDQTSLHNPFNGGYYPVQLTFEEAQEAMVKNPEAFKSTVQESLRRHAAAINNLAARGMSFWDYGNSFLLESFRAGADVLSAGGGKTAAGGPRFRYPSYVEDIMGDIFSLGFGPFRWVCTSGNPGDLAVTDKIAEEVTERLRSHCVGEHKDRSMQHYEDNLKWIREAGKHQLVVGSQARILYSDAVGRMEIALAFNRAVREGRLTAPVVLSRDHHDVSGTDSPFRETSNITDGSMFCADMAIQNVIGDSFRGATWVSIHNGGGTGWGEAVNGGFGMVLDGSLDSDRRSSAMLHWDVINGIARRAWAGNSNAKFAIDREAKEHKLLKFTVPYAADADLLKSLVPS